MKYRVYDEEQRKVSNQEIKVSEDSMMSISQYCADSTNKSAGQDNTIKSEEFAMALENSSGHVINSEIQRNYDIETLQRALEDPNERQSQLCCLCLCDLVKASIIMNVIWIMLEIGYIYISATDSERLQNSFGIVPLFGGDSSAVDDGESSSINAWAIVGIVKIAIGFVGCILGIYGAVRFNKYFVLTACLGYLQYAILTLADYKSGRWIGAFLAVIFAYPSIHLFVSIRNGNMTRETYEREASCCGNNSHSDY